MAFPRTVLLTGGCGFLGRHFAKHFAEQGCDITLVDDLSTGLYPDQWPSFLRVPEATFVRADLREYLKEEKRSFDLAVHLAAVVGGRAVMEGKPALNAHSLELDALFFRWAAQHKPKQIVYMSSPAIYPIDLQGDEEKGIALKEDLVDLETLGSRFGMPDLVYGWSKLSGEFLASTFAKHYGLNVFCPRPFSGYGEDQDPSYPVPAICARAVNQENPLVIWGSGKQTRDFIYVDDIVEAIISYLPKLRGYETMNLGRGVSNTFRDVAELAATYAGYSPAIKNLEDKPEGVKSRFADIARMKEHYQAKVSLEEGVKRVVDYLLQ